MRKSEQLQNSYAVTSPKIVRLVGWNRQYKLREKNILDLIQDNSFFQV